MKRNNYKYVKQSYFVYSTSNLQNSLCNSFSTVCTITMSSAAGPDTYVVQVESINNDPSNTAVCSTIPLTNPGLFVLVYFLFKN